MKVDQSILNETLKKKAAEVYSSYSYVSDEQVAEILGISEKKLKALMKEKKQQ